MGIELLIVGLDGVVFDTEDAHLWSCNTAFKNCELDLHWSMPQLRKAIQTWGVTNAIAEIGGISDYASSNDIIRLTNERNRLFREFILANKLTPNPACARLMEEALDSGCKLAVVTEMPSQNAALLLEQAFGDEFNSTLSVILSGANFNVPADNGPHRLVLRTIGVDVSDCIAIEAFSPALRAAQRAGIWTVATTTSEENTPEVTNADLWCPALQMSKHLRGRTGMEGSAPGQFVTFDALKALRHQDLSGITSTKKSLDMYATA